VAAASRLLAAVADGRLQSLVSMKGHAGVLVDGPQAQGPVADSISSVAKNKAQRAGRTNKRKAPGKHPGAKGQAPASLSGDVTQDDATSA